MKEWEDLLTDKALTVVLYRTVGASAASRMIKRMKINGLQ
jgi:hypothetical protein